MHIQIIHPYDTDTCLYQLWENSQQRLEFLVSTAYFKMSVYRCTLSVWRFKTTVSCKSQSPPAEKWPRRSHASTEDLLSMTPCKEHCKVCTVVWLLKQTIESTGDHNISESDWVRIKQILIFTLSQLCLLSGHYLLAFSLLLHRIFVFTWNGDR